MKVDQRISAMLKPSSVAVIGASASRRAAGNQVIENLRAHNFGGSLCAVHPRADLVSGVESVRTIRELPLNLDVAVLALPPASAIAALDDLESRQCKSAIIPSAGWGSRETQLLREFVKHAHIAVHGPNGMGVLNFSDDIPLWIIKGYVTEGQPGNIALVSQSGTALSATLRSVSSCRFSKVISSGNEYGLASSDYLLWLAQDPMTRAVGLITESIQDVDEFAHAIDSLRSADKPVVALKVGISSIGARITAAHTGAIIGQNEAFRALFTKLDVPLVNDYDELASVLDYYGGNHLKASAGSQIGVITLSGGQGALVADQAASVGIELANFSDETTAALNHVLPSVDGSPPSNPCDASASLLFETGFSEGAKIIARDHNVDSLLFVIDAQLTMHDSEIEWNRPFYEAALEVAKDNSGVPILLCSSTSTSLHPTVQGWIGVGVPFVRGVRNALVVLAALKMNQRPVGMLRHQVTNRRHPQLDWLQRTVAASEEQVPEDVSVSFLEEYGFDVARSILTIDPDTAVEWAANCGYPVVVKAVGPEIQHSSDIGGVLKDIDDAVSLREAFVRIQGNVLAAEAQTELTSFRVQEQLPSSLEVMFGFIDDPVVGPVVTVGLGGTLIELLDDSVYAIAPVTVAEAVDMLQASRVRVIANGYRNLMPVTSLTATASSFARFSQLAYDLRGIVSAGELNPVMVEYQTGQVRIVDWLFLTS